MPPLSQMHTAIFLIDREVALFRLFLGRLAPLLEILDDIFKTVMQVTALADRAGDDQRGSGQLHSQ